MPALCCIGRAADATLQCLKGRKTRRVPAACHIAKLVGQAVAALLTLSNTSVLKMLTTPPLPIPSCLAVSRPMRAWSPVIIFTIRPCSTRHLHLALMAPPCWKSASVLLGR